MPNRYREKKARDAANLYALRPEGSALLYGLIAMTLAGLGMIVFEMFYGANIFAYPVIIAIVLAVVFFAGIILRKRRKRLHTAAYQAEYAKQDNSPPAKGHGSERQ